MCARVVGTNAARAQTTPRYAPNDANEDDSEQILRIHAAVDELSALDARMAKIVEMRYFAGFDDDEIATALGITDRTVRREWQKARLYLAQSLS
jgi:RNA polymerase sigma factor (sigma-70 family)